MHYVDSNVFLYPVLYPEEKQPKSKEAKEILLNIETGKLKASTSMLTWDEVVWVTTKLLGSADGKNQGRKLIGFPNLQFIDVNERIVVHAQNLIEKYELSPRDSIHLASALEGRAEAVISDDDDFDQVKEIKRIPISPTRKT
jgi:predicted nucleic acid-binding protein